MEFNTAEQARIWAAQRNEKAKKLSMCVSELILIKKTTTVVEEILDYV